MMEVFPAFDVLPFLHVAGDACLFSLLASGVFFVFSKLVRYLLFGFVVPFEENVVCRSDYPGPSSEPCGGYVDNRDCLFEDSELVNLPKQGP